MKKKNYPLATDTWDWREKLAILKVLASGKYTMGKEVRKFEQEFAAKFEVPEAIMVNSGSSANLIGLAAWKMMYNIPDGAEIIVPAVSWSTTYFPITQLNMIPVFVDVDDNFNIHATSVRAAITSKTAAIFAVNLLGQPASLNILKTLAIDNKIHLLEDNCESLGAFLNNKKAGTFGTFGTFSFFFSHHLQTMEGGMIVCHTTELADYMRSLRAHGWVRDIRIRTKSLYLPGTYPKWEEKYKFILPGYCVRPLEMSAAAGREQLKKMDSLIEGRIRNGQTFKSHFNQKGIMTQSGVGSSWFGFGVVLPESIPRNYIIGKLEGLGVETRPIVTGNFLNQPVMSRIPHRTWGDFTNAEMIDKQGFYFGNSHKDLTEKIIQIAEVLDKS